ncbi:hypothetical protein KP509_02G104700 [Ceratopteris richardii]|nr:hypothetical protein KP509_02G104700 [Ceratopteris richardii]
MKPWLFWKKKGSKILDVGERKVEVHWDLSSAKYGSSPEPLEGFYLAVICGCEVVLLLGNMLEGAHKRALSLSPLHHRLKPTLISRTEHIVGKRFYSTKAQFRENGSPHDIVIECQIAGKDPRFSLRIDRQLMLQVKRLMWKFRGNYTIMVDGLPVELLWDVHNWLFNQSDNHAVFMFQVGARSPVVGKQDCASSASCIQWHQHNIAKKSPRQGEEVCGFSLLLYAWNSE